MLIMDATPSMGSKLNTALQTNVNPQTIMDGFIEVLPWVGTLVAVGFLIYEGKKLIKGAGKGKVRL